MRRGQALLLLAVLLAGCGAPAEPPAPTEPTVALVALDGRWDFDAAAAGALAGHRDPGRAWLGEAALGRVAGEAWGLDATAARLLDVPAPPAPGSVVLRDDVAAAAGAQVGDELELRAWTWPAPLVVAAFEMDRVRPCDDGTPAQLCSERAEGTTRAHLLLIVPPGSRDLRYHPDVVELTPKDYPATWVGEFVAPDGVRIPFQTAARTRSDLDPPGLAEGPLAPGTWRIEFELTLNGTLAPGAVAGFVTLRAPGFPPFDSDVARVGDPARQTREVLERASERTARLRVSAVAPANGSLTRLGIAAVLAPEDARRLYGIAEGNATALVVPHRAGDAEALAAAVAVADVPALRMLRVREVVDLPAPRVDDGVRWAPAGEAILLAVRAPPMGTLRLHETTLDPGARILALPASGEPPWTLVAGAHWGTRDEALRNLASSPHLVLVSADLAREAGLDPGALTYARLEMETGLGPRTVFVMGAVEGGPSRTVWVSAALLTTLGAPAGGRALDGGLPLV